jgi:RNA polymerase sigma factor (sigma-70 family)
VPNTGNVALDPRMQRAVEDHLGMADSITWRFFTRIPGGDIDELRSIAFEALTRAAARWIDPYCSSRGFYPWSADDPSKPEAHFGGYAAKMVKGSLLDWARQVDHLTRTQRRTVKALQAAQDDGARTEEELAAAAGLSVQKAREVLAADAARPVSLDMHSASTGYDGGYGGIADDDADVEGQAAVSGILAGFLAAFDSLPAVQQVILALVFHQELELEVAAKEVYLEEKEARRQLEQAVCQVHGALLLAVSDEGTGGPIGRVTVNTGG